MLDVVQHLQRLPRPRILRDRSNPLQEYDNIDFKIRFRLSKDTFMALLHEIGHHIEKQTARSKAVSASNQLLIALRYYATGAFQTVIGDHIHVNKSTVCRIIRCVTVCIARMREQYISMPQGNSLQTVKQDFFSISNFPNVIGAIDCSHMKIQSPGGHLNEMFRNRKGFLMSLHVGLGQYMTVLYLMPVFYVQSLKTMNIPNCFLLGDNGYPCRAYLLTPLLHPATEAEENYQRSHIATRNTVERLFGVWKRRFPVLALGMRTKISTTLATIVATAVLHNIANEHNENLPEGDVDVEVVDVPVEPVRNNGNATRRALINTVFSRQ
ncbi:putative nuclease HARBI1 [Periplaneta americana]|uniref:putative nuclease HARBI1 n=1 Tax=Periplaneta americana TaxID=6978 RepID=UPI0037E94C9D